MRSRGAALPTVLALVSLVLVVGLSMGSMSTLSLRFSNQYVANAQSEYAARSAIALFLSRFHKHDVLSTLNPLKPEPVDMATVFPNGITVEQNGYTARVHFGTGEGHCTDNLMSEEPRVGWPDTDGVPRVPPFGIDVIINVETPSGNIERYRAVLERVWPFAVYADQGPLTITGRPGTDKEHFSTVVGDVFTAWRGSATGGSAEYDIGRGYGLGLLDQPSKVLANLEAGSGYLPYRLIKHHLIIGSIEHWNGQHQFEVEPDPDDDPTVAFSKYLASANPRMVDLDTDYTDPTFGTPDTESGAISSYGNVLEGDFVDDHDQGLQIPPIIIGVTGPAPPPLGPAEMNEHKGEHFVRTGMALDPLTEIRESSSNPFAALEGPGNSSVPGLQLPNDDWLQDVYSIDPASPELVRDGGGSRPYIIEDTLELSDGTFKVDGSISNRQIVYHQGNEDDPEIEELKGLYLKEHRAGLILQDATMLVDGDLNLGAAAFSDPSLGLPVEEQTVPVSGSGSILAVSGMLVLGNAHFNAGDRGFVIYAKDIVLKGGGTFHGLLLAENSVTLLSQADAPLEVRGGILCAGDGGVTVRGAKVFHDPAYLSAINGGGDFHLASWRKLQ